MRYRKKSDREHCRLFIFLLSVAMIVFIALLKTEKSIKPVAELQAEHIAQKTAAQVIEKTVSDYLEANRFTYSDFAAVLYDNEKKVSAIETLPYNINKVQSELDPCWFSDEFKYLSRKRSENQYQGLACRLSADKNKKRFFKCRAKSDLSQNFSSHKRKNDIISSAVQL